MNANTDSFVISKNERPILIQVTVLNRGGGRLRLLTSRRDIYMDIQVEHQAFLDCVRKLNEKINKVQDELAG